jgi:hypothetical protein
VALVAYKKGDRSNLMIPAMAKFETLFQRTAAGGRDPSRRRHPPIGPGRISHPIALHHPRPYLVAECRPAGCPQIASGLCQPNPERTLSFMH